LDFSFLVSTASTTHRNTSKGTPSSPVSPTGFAKVAGLREVIVIEVAKLGVGRFTPWAL
jgi:hypothetical protein